MSEKEGRREGGRESEAFSTGASTLPVVCFVSHLEVSPQGIVSSASLSAVFRNYGVAGLIEN